jgi:hypothetical protein
MKKLLSIIVLGLLLSGNAYSEVTNLICEYKETYYRNWNKNKFGETIIDESIAKIAYFSITKNNDNDYGFETNIRLPNLQNIKDEKFVSIVDENNYLFTAQKNTLYVSIGINRLSGTLTTQTGHRNDNGKYLIQDSYVCKKGEQKF